MMKSFYRNVIYNRVNFASTLSYERDPGIEFINPDTQKVLKSITRLDFGKIFSKRTVPKNDVEHKFMTTKQIENEIRTKYMEAEKLLQMPPIVKAIEERQKVISKDPALKGFSTSSFVFTDISYGLKNSERFIVVRTPDGLLEHAPNDIRKRVCQIYFPQIGRKFREPKMFENDNLQRLMDNNEYEFIMDNLCLQYEPYEKQFHNISSKVYIHINDNQQFDKLRSTRHFGPMAFFLSWHKMIDNLLLEMIRMDHMKNGVELISLMYKLNSIKYDTEMVKEICKSSYDLEEIIMDKVNEVLGKPQKDLMKKEKIEDELNAKCFEYIQEYVNNNNSLKKPQLELALQTYKEQHNEVQDRARQ